MPEELRTRLLATPEGTEEWRVSRCRLTVKRGPDKGRALEVERDRVTVGSGASCDLRLTDPAVSRRQFEVAATEQGFLLTDEGSTNGTYVDGHRVVACYVRPGVRITVGASELRFAAMEGERAVPLSPHHRFGELLGRSRAMRALFAVLERVAPTSATVLIEGESGTGKELVARELHRASPRHAAPFITVDCGALPHNLIESELFGHERGAFTDASSAREGAFEAADGGTLFLDEIGELPTEAQTRLLRALEQREVRRLGAQAPIAVDVRVVAATNRNLDDEVEAERFRRDLFFRLAVCRVWVPPLRQRPEDVELLTRHFLGRAGVARDPEQLLTTPLLQALQRYHWPGNARELRNVAERLAIFPELPVSDAIAPAPARGDAGAWRAELASLPYHEARQRILDDFERGYVEALLIESDWVVAHAAARAGLPRQTVHRLMKRHDLRRPPEP